MIYHFYLKKLKVEEVEKLAANLHDEKEYAMHIKNLKQILKFSISIGRSS